MTSSFSTDNYQQWEERAAKELKGKSPETLNWQNSSGLSFHAYYDSSRRYPATYRARNDAWDAYEVIRVTNCQEANEQALNALNSGAAGLRFEWKNPDVKEISTLLKDIELPFIQSAFVIPFASYPEFCLGLAEFLRRKAWASDRVEGYIQPDYSLVNDGGELAAVLDECLEIIPAVSAALSGYRLLVIDMGHFANAGLLAHQELGLALAWFHQWLFSVQQRGVNPDKMAHLWQLNLGCGQDFYTELVKFRISGHLHSLVAGKYGAYKPIYVLAAGTQTAISSLDRYTNLLRLTTAAQSAVLGNCNGLHLPAFSSNPADKSSFARRISFNIQSVLYHETGVAETQDAAAGSYFFEEMSFALAEQAWAFFLEVEEAGGLKSYLSKGKLETLLTENKSRAENAVKNRKRFMLGVNQFPSPMEKVAPFHAPPTGVFEPLQLSSVFHELKQGKPKKALLLKYGNVAMRNARAGFISNFLGCGNWLCEEIIFENDKTYSADMLVLCSADDEYEALLKEMNPGNVPVYIAGMPGEKQETYHEMEVKGFIHARSPLYDTLKNLQKEVGDEKI